MPYSTIIKTLAHQVDLKIYHNRATGYNATTMRILLLNHNLIWRGTFFRCMGFARELARQGHQVDLWTVSREWNSSGCVEPLDGVRIWQTPRWGRPGRHDGGYALLDNLARLASISIDQWDVIHAFDHRPNVLLPWFLQRSLTRFSSQPPLFVSDWCDWWTEGGITTARRPFAWIDRLEQRIEVGSKQISDGVTVISSVLRERARSAGIEDERLLTLPAGVMSDAFPVIEKQDARNQLGIASDKPLLGFIGYSLWDIQLLADLFAAVKEQRNDALLLAIGGGVEDSALQPLRERFQPDADVLLPGVIPFEQVPAYLAACDVLLLPLEDTLANRARVPNKLADYFASGRPVVASHVGETASLIKQHQAGILAYNPNNFAQACVELLNQPSKAHEMGAKGRQTAETEWAYQTLTKQLVEFYQRLLNKRLGKT
ncbi:MAG: glycosyltransferase family 4 protein [Candidatus Hinthialibacter antarcticus]|nr:glycosyltransferase family 4 protein [Candidatus Hinthialibacter antarcticus]